MVKGQLVPAMFNSRIAKQLLLAEIRANLSSSSGQDDTSDAESKVDEDKDGMREGDGEKNDTEDSELTDNSSDSDGPARPSLSRHRLLQCSVTPWEVASQDDGNKPDDKRPKKKKTQSSKISDSSDERESASEDSALSEVISQSEDENASVLEDLVYDGEPRTPPPKDIGDGPTDGENAENCTGTPKGRRKIRKILEVQQLAKETQEALREEEERRKRLAEREQQRRQEEESKKHRRDDSEVMIIAKTPAARPIPLVLELDDATRECLVQVDTQLLVKLKPHQRQGVQFMWDSCCESIAKVKVSPGSGCLLAHCMGLGKTLQVITFLHTVLTCERVELKTALVVCPLNTVLNWRSEFDKWQRGIVKKKLEVMDLVKVKSVCSRVNALTSWHKRGGVMILSYELYRMLIYGDQGKYGKQQESLLGALQDPGPDIVVCDEGHLLKNEATAICKAMRSIRTRRRIVLTGTPLQNNLSEYHCMVSFVKQNLLGSLREFRNRFMNPIQNGQCADSTPSDVRLMKKRVHVLHELLAGCVQRRDYTVLMPFLPPKREYVLSIRMTPLQCRLYTHYLQNCTGEGVNTLFQDFQILSLIWTHPWCLQLSDHNRGNKGRVEEILSEIAETGEVSEVTQPQNADERALAESRVPNLDKTSPEEERRVVTGSMAGWYREFVSDSDAKILEHSGKLALLMEILHCAEQQHEKVLVFSQSLVSLDLIETFLELANKAKIEAKSSVYKGKQMWVRNKDYYRLTGSTTATARKKWAQEFNNVRNTRCRLFLISTRAGSLGINLVAANRVVVFDASWNPVYDIQSMFRVYRFGQKKAVYIYRFLAQGTMEQKIYERQVAKQSLSSRVVDQQQIQRHFTQSQLRELYHFQPDTCVQKHIVEPADKVLAVLLQCCGEAVVSFHEHDSLLGHRVEEELSMEERKEAWEEYQLEETRVSAQDSGELWRKSNQELKAMLESGRMDLQKASQNIKPKCLEVMKRDPMMDREKLKQKAFRTYERFNKDTQGRVEIYQQQVFSQQKILENRAGLSSSAPPSVSVSSAYEAGGSSSAPPTPLFQSSQSNGSVNQPQ